jgi:hypothetical protein
MRFIAAEFQKVKKQCSSKKPATSPDICYRYVDPGDFGGGFSRSDEHLRKSMAIAVAIRK